MPVGPLRSLAVSGKEASNDSLASFSELPSAVVSSDGARGGTTPIDAIDKIKTVRDATRDEGTRGRMRA